MAKRVSAVSPATFQTFGELLRYLRKVAELSQRELAIHVGYHYSYMSRIENGEHTPDAATLMARFVPALGLEMEPAWTKRLLELASAGEKGGAAQLESKTRAPEPGVDSEPDPLDSRAAMFPVSLTPLLGRQAEITALVQSLSQRDVRLINLIGPPGVGKTRLAVEVATAAAGHFAHGLNFIDLAPIRDAASFLPALAQNLGVNEIPDIPLSTRLAGALRQKNILLVLDNFEQLVEAAPQVYQLLRSTTQVKMLVTSRVPLHIAGEMQFTVQPLALPRGQALDQDWLAFAAIRLFVDRAHAVRPSFQLTKENREAVLAICRQLDGLPLAIELAAARVRTFTPQVMLKEIKHRFDWLAPNLREEQLEKQTLRGTIDWSYNLLSEKEQLLLCRLAVFSGGRTVEAVKAVCAGVASDRPVPAIQPDEILDLLVQLTDKSLLFTDTQQGEVRFNFLETIHEYARDKLRQRGEDTVLRNRHLAYFCRLAEQFEREIEGENQTEWLDKIELEHNNMRAALDWALQEGADLTVGARLAASLGLFWYLHSHFVEGLGRSKLFLRQARRGSDQRVLAKLLFRTADLYLHQAEFDAALRLGQEAVALCKKIDDKQLLAWALYVLADIYLALNDLQAAQTSLDEGVAVCREIGYEAVQDISLLLLSTVRLRQGDLDAAHQTALAGLSLAEALSDPWSIASGLQILGEIYLQKKDYLPARRYFERSLEASRAVGDKIITGGALVNLAVLTNRQQQFSASDHYAEEALSIFQLIGDETKQPYPLRIMAYAAVHAGNLVRARVLLRESLRGSANLQNTREQLACLIGFARYRLAEADFAGAVRLCALADGQRQAQSFMFDEPDNAMLSAIVAQCRRQLGGAEYESAWQQGATEDVDEVIGRLLV